MEIFKLFESTMTDLQPGQNIRHLRRDQLLDNYEASAKTLQTLIRAKESEIKYRKDLIRMLDEAKSVYDTKLAQARQDYQTAKSNTPASIDIKTIGRLDPSILNERSTTPPMPPPPTPPAPSSIGALNNPIMASSTTTPLLNAAQLPNTNLIQPTLNSNNSYHHPMLPPQQPVPPAQTSTLPHLHPMLNNANQSPGSSAIPSLVSATPNHGPTTAVPWTPTSSARSNNELDNIPFPSMGDSHDNRSSLDRRLSEFMKTFPNISQAGLVPPSSIDTTKPPPGYYTQQTPQPPQSIQQQQQQQPSPQAQPQASVHSTASSQHHHHHHHPHHHHSSRR